jgi:hypothetical protein
MNKNVRPLVGTALLLLAAIASSACKQADAGRVAAVSTDAVGVAGTPVQVIVNIPAGRDAPADLAGQAATWRKAGIVNQALWVNSKVEEKPKHGFASLLTLEFPNEAAYTRWSSAELPKLAAPLVARRAEVLAQEKVAAYDPNITLFKVSYYTPSVSREEVAKWVKGYLAKYLHAQLQAGILVSYTMYLEEGAAPAGQMLLVLQYHDATIARDAEPIKGKLNDGLAATDEEYATLAAAKESIRVTQSVTVAEYQPLPIR